jgi:hypothetical protein
MPIYVQNWRVLKDIVVHEVGDGTSVTIPAGYIVCYQTQDNLMGAPGITMHHAQSRGRGGTGKNQIFTGYNIKATKARLVPGGIMITTPEKTTVWLMASMVYKDVRTKKPAHTSLEEALGFIDTT